MGHPSLTLGAKSSNREATGFIPEHADDPGTVISVQFFDLLPHFFFLSTSNRCASTTTNSAGSKSEGFSIGE